MSIKSILRIAGGVLLIHGLLEILGLLAFFTGQAPPFIFLEIRENWQQAIFIGFIAGAIRVISAIGVFRGMKWGLALGIIFSAITLTTLTFYLPYGMMDALLSGIVLVLLVKAYWGEEKIAM